MRITLDGVEYALKISGAGAKQVLAALWNIATTSKKTKGQARLGALLKSGKELTVFKVAESDLEMFATEAKRYGVLYAIIKDVNPEKGAMVDVMVKAEDAAKLNRIVEKLEYAHVDVEDVVSEVEQEIKDKAAEKAEAERGEDSPDEPEPLDPEKAAAEADFINGTQTTPDKGKSEQAAEQAKPDGEQATKSETEPAIKPDSEKTTKSDNKQATKPEIKQNAESQAGQTTEQKAPDPKQPTGNTAKTSPDTPDKGVAQKSEVAKEADEQKEKPLKKEAAKTVNPPEAKTDRPAPSEPSSNVRGQSSEASTSNSTKQSKYRQIQGLGDTTRERQSVRGHLSEIKRRQTENPRQPAKQQQTRHQTPTPTKRSRGKRHKTR
jgi:hypothetical protein